MNAPYALVLASLLVQIGSKGPVAAAQKATSGTYDNNNPREQQARLEGAGKRALAAHANGYEAIPPFAAGVVAAMQDPNPLVAGRGLARAGHAPRVPGVRRMCSNPRSKGMPMRHATSAPAITEPRATAHIARRRVRRDE